MTAGDGREAAHAARDKSFDVIVSDIAMPEMDGLELLRAVREHDLDVPFVIMTGGPGVDSAARAMEYGALRYLIKPVEPAELEEVVARAVRLHQMAKIKREALEMFRLEGKHLGDRASLEARLGARDGDAVDRVPADRVVVAPDRRSPTRRWSATRSRRCARRPTCSRRPSGWGGCRSWGAPSAITSRARWTSSRCRRCCSSTCTRWSWTTIR